MWQEDLAVLRYLEGPIYRSRRDALLASPPPELAGTLEQDATSPDPRRAITARILIGWLAHRPLFEEVLADLDFIDAEAESRRAGGIEAAVDLVIERAARRGGAALLPLAWEGITRFATLAPEWRTLAFVRIVSLSPDEASIEPLIACLESAPTYRLADACARALERMPRDRVVPRAEAMLARHLERAGLYQRISRSGGGE